MFVDYYSSFAENYAKNISKNQNETGYRDYDPEVMAYVLMGISNFIGLRYTLFSKSDDLEEVVDEVLKILENGIFK